MPMLQRSAAVAALLLIALAGPLSAGGPASFDPPYFRPDSAVPNVPPLIEGWNLALIQITPNRAYIHPFAGYRLYPGEPGSGYGSWSDYSHINWLIPPEQSAANVRERLRLMGIPAVTPEPVFLNKNPAITDGLRLPIPRPKAAKEDKEVEK
jgi:hypothetical protein